MPTNEEIFGNINKLQAELRDLRSYLADDTKEARNLERVLRELNALTVNPRTLDPKTLAGLGKYAEAATTTGARVPVPGAPLERTKQLLDSINVAEERRSLTLRHQAEYAERQARALGGIAGVRDVQNNAIGEEDGFEQNDRLTYEKAKRDKEFARKWNQAQIDNANYDRAQSLKSDLPGGVNTYNSLIRRASARGFGAEDVTNINKNASTGITDVKFISKDQTGTAKEFTSSIDALGHVTDKVNRKFQGLTEGVMRNTMEFVKWSLAVALVLGPLQKVSEVAQATVEQQDKLVNITIALGNAQKDANVIYEEAYKVSQNVSEEVGNVLDAYTLAYRATGGAADESTRFTIATTLLKDSLVLSKLAGMEEATAIDTLTASLKQSESGLDQNNNALLQGTTLLDKWVRATKIANIDLESLATSFAVAGDVSAKAGLDVNGLIGLIAALGETGIASGRELANMSKAIVSGFQSDTGSKILESYGISLTNLKGEVRDFTDVMDQLSSMQKEGILSKGQYSDITLALGGGVRRQSIWSTLIENWSRVQQVSEGVADAQGDAQEAMAKKYDTVSSASTRYANSISNLAMTMGTKGGLLDSFTLLLKVLTGITSGFEKLSGITGRIGPTLIAMGAVSALGGLRGDAFKTSVNAKMGSLIAWGAANTGGRHLSDEATIRRSTSEGPVWVSPRQMYAEQASQNAMQPRKWLGGSAMLSGLGALALTGITAGANFSDQSATETQRKSRGWANIVGGIGGAAAGAMTGMNVMIAAAVGTAISEAFVNATVARTQDFQKLFEKVIPKGTEEPGTTEKTTAEQLDKVLQEVYRGMGKNYDAGGGGGVAQFWGSAKASVQSWFYNSVGIRGPVVNDLIEKEGFKPESISPEQLAMLRATPEQRKRLEDIRAEAEPESLLQTERYAQIQKSVWEKFGSSMEEMSKNLQDELLQKLVMGDITSSDYKRSMEATGKFNTNLTAVYGGIGEKYQTATGKNAEQSILDFAEVLTYSSEEQSRTIFDLINDMNELTTSLQNTSLSETDRAKTVEELNAKEAATVKLLEQLNVQLATQIKLNPLVDLNQLTGAQIKGLEPKAEALALERFLAKGGTMAQYPDVKSARESWVADTSTGYQTTTAPLEEMQYLINELIESGELSTTTKTPGWRSLDMTRPAFDAAMGKYGSTRGDLMQAGASSKEEDQVVVFSDGTMDVLKKDWKIVEYLLAEILDVNTKELQTNMYNFPAGMTAWVPLGAANSTVPQGSPGYSSSNNEVTALGEVTTDINKLNSASAMGLAGINNAERRKLLYGADYDIGLNRIPSPRAFDAEASIGKLKLFGKADASVGKSEVSIDKSESSIGKLKASTALEKFLSTFLTSIALPSSSLGSSLFDNSAGSGRRGGGASKLQNFGKDNTGAGEMSKINLDIKSTFYIQLDGKTLAMQMSRYMGDSMVRSSRTASAGTKINLI